MLYETARDEKVKVVCNWYNKHPNYIFTYDGPRDSEEYSLESTLGLVEFEAYMQSETKVCLRDPSQGPRLDSLLNLTKPSKKSGVKRTRGEEIIATEAKAERETSRVEDEGVSFCSTGYIPRLSKLRCGAGGS